MNDIFKSVSPLLLFLTITLFSCRDEVEKTRPEFTSLSESIYASITVNPENKYYAYAPVNGILKRIQVSEGDTVTRGQVIIEIDNTNPELNAQNARLAYELARENITGNRTALRELENQLKAMRLKRSNDSLNFLRQKNLRERNIGSQMEFDQRKLAFEVSSNEAAAIQAKYDQLKNQLEIQLKQAELNYKASLKTSTDFSVKSEINGKVYELRKEPGELVNIQEPVAMIGDKSVFIIELLVDEVDIAKTAIGQKVLIRLDAYGKEIFEASVSKIYPKMDTRSQTFKVEAKFHKQPLVLYPGLTGEANIIIAQKEKALTIPYEYLIGENRVKTENGEIEVMTGLKNFERVEIVSGLDSGSVIYKPR